MRIRFLLPLLALSIGGCFGDANPSHTGTGSGGGNGNTAGGDMGIDLDPQCGKQTFPIALAKSQPNILLVVDESGSMADPIGGSTQSKWDALKAAVNQLVTTVAPDVHWGLSIFPAIGAAATCAPGIIDVPVGAGNNQAIMNKLSPIAASFRSHTEVMSPCTSGRKLHSSG